MLGAVIEENQIIEISKMFLNTWLHWFSCTLKVFIKSLTITQVFPYTAAKRAHGCWDFIKSAVENLKNYL